MSEELKEWIREGKVIGAKYVISVCDTFDYTDYPVFVMANEKLEDIKKEYDNVNMQRINKVKRII